jgi:hypothetical protein
MAVHSTCLTSSGPTAMLMADVSPLRGAFCPTAQRTAALQQDWLLLAALNFVFRGLLQETFALWAGMHCLSAYMSSVCG